MGKVNMQQMLERMNHSLRNLMGINKYAETQESVDNKLQSIEENVEKLCSSIETMDMKIQETADNINGIKIELSKVESGLQKELFQSLREYHTKFTHRGWASFEEKQEAKLYYDEIHALNKDGWSDKYIEEILALPESKMAMYNQ